MTPADSTDASPPGDLDALHRRIDEVLDRARTVVEGGPYEPTWDSLGAHDEAPEWFRDAKFGIYCHWGVYSVPAFDTEWYPHFMYKDEPAEGDMGLGGSRPVPPHHREQYGEPDEYPYQRFVPDFTAARFDPDAWAALFEQVGARFAGLTAEHHDGWSNWDSAINPWNAGDRGPERDLVGDLARAVRERDMKFLASMHHARTSQFFRYATENYPSVTEGYPDQVMYGNLDGDRFEDLWLAKLVELIDAYCPDLIYHDGPHPTVSDEHYRRYLAYYLTAAADRDPVVTAKNQELPLEVAVEDFERGRPAEQLERPWLTDDSITTNGWSHTQREDLRSAETIVHELIDVVSKNGCLLLNVGPRADGTIPESQRDVLRSIGEWLDVHGEAIYETRPWRSVGEGPTTLEEGGQFLDDVTYTADDVRYTRSKDETALYAIVLGWPDRETVTLESVPGEQVDSAVRLLGHEGEIGWRTDGEGRVAIRVPDLEPSARPSEVAVAFELSGQWT